MALGRLAGTGGLAAKTTERCPHLRAPQGLAGTPTARQTCLETQAIAAQPRVQRRGWVIDTRQKCVRGFY